MSVLRRSVCTVVVVLLTLGLSSAPPAGAVSPTGSITGRVTSASTGDPLPAFTVAVYVFGPDGTPRSRYAVSDGKYTVDGLDPDVDYTVCVDTEYAPLDGGVGYPDRCYRDAPWNGSYDLPPGTTPVRVSAGAMSTADFALPLAGAIAGRITAADDGAALHNADVDVVDSAGAGGPFPFATNSNGGYKVPRLEPGRSYYVCVDSERIDSGNQPYGYLSQCYQDVAWDGAGPIPAASVAVPVTGGAVTAGVSARLRDAGAISGSVRDAASLAPVKAAFVLALDDSGTTVSSTSTDADGQYTLRHLAAATHAYRVCFNQGSGAPAAAPTGYAPQCWRTQPGYPSPAPAGAARASVSTGVATTNVNGRLTPGGKIHVRVSRADGGRVIGALVRVFDAAGVQRDFEFTDFGSATFTGLLPSKQGYTVCVDPGRFGTVPSGLRPTCWQDTAWGGGVAPPSPDATKIRVAAGQVRNVTIIPPPA